MTTRIIIAGATGWTGSAVAKAIDAADDLELAAAISPSKAGQNLNSLIGGDNTLPLSASIEQALQHKADILIDFTKPDVVKHNVITALNAGLHVVIGTSGLSDQDYQDIDALAQQQGLGALAAGNFAITAVLLQKFSLMAAKYIPQWEIIDYAKSTKPDAPSGTVRELAYRLGEQGQPQYDLDPAQTGGVKETRGATINGTQVHAIRLPGFVLGAETIFGMPGEKLSIKHEAGASAEPYVAGVLLASRNVAKLTGLVRGLDQVMD